jgi:hypothetical protein
MILVPVLQDCHSVFKLYIASAPFSSQGGWYLAMLSMYEVPIHRLASSPATTLTLYLYLSFFEHTDDVANIQSLVSNPPGYAVSRFLNR